MGPDSTETATPHAKSIESDPIDYAIDYAYTSDPFNQATACV